MSKKIALVSVKGGVGKTTTCINLAAYIAAMGLNVLLVDLDPQNGVMFGLGLDGRNRNGLKDVVAGRVAAAEAVTETNRPELRVVTAGNFATGEEIEDFIRKFEADPTLLRRILDDILTDGRFVPELVLLDCPSGLGTVTLNALVAAQSIILPVQCEPLSLRTLPQMLRCVQAVKAKYNPDLEVEGVLTTMYDTRLEAKLGVAEQIWNDFPEDMVFETVIPRHEHLVHSFAVGAPAIDISARSSGSQAYIQLGRELIMRLPENAPVAG